MRLSLSHRRYRLRFREPVRTAHGLWGQREGILVRVSDHAGRSGFGEVAPIPWFGTETIEQADKVLAGFGGALASEAPEVVPEQYPCVRFAIYSALVGVGLGDSVNGDPAPTDYLAMAALLPAGRAAFSIAASKAELGFRLFKWKVGLDDPAGEIAMLEDLIALLPSGVKFRLDANGALDRRRAERWLARCADLPVEFVEQPVAPSDVDLLLGLAADYPTPLGLDESLVSSGDVERWLRLGWPGYYVVKPSLIGDAASACESLARAGANVVFSSALESCVGAKRILEMAFRWPGRKHALGMGVWPLFEERQFDGPPAAPFIRWAEVSSISEEVAWNAAS